MMAERSDVDKLKNTFYVIRHGEAVCNVEHLLVSDPDIGTTQYGLTDLGRQQAKDAAHKFESMLSSSVDQSLSEKIVIVSSDFRRTRETAEILHSELGVKRPIRFEIALRERGLGSMNMTYNWDSVRQMWALDEVDPTHTEYSCESVMSMTVRTSRLVQQLDKEYNDMIIILVSHGDPCQCLYAIFIGQNPDEFRKIARMKNCEIRSLKEPNE